MAAVPPVTELTCQVTAVLGVLATAAFSCTVEPTLTCGLPVTVTVIDGLFVEEPPAQPVSSIRASDPAARHRLLLTRVSGNLRCMTNSATFESMGSSGWGPIHVVGNRYNSGAVEKSRSFCKNVDLDETFRFLMRLCGNFEPSESICMGSLDRLGGRFFRRDRCQVRCIGVGENGSDCYIDMRIWAGPLGPS